MSNSSQSPQLVSLTGLFPAQQSFPMGYSEIEEEPSDRRILIVDDERSIRDMFAQWLSDDFECRTAG